jgi:hypothetical protein
MQVKINPVVVMGEISPAVSWQGLTKSLVLQNDPNNNLNKQDVGAKPLSCDKNTQGLRENCL